MTLRAVVGLVVAGLIQTAGPAALGAAESQADVGTATAPTPACAVKPALRPCLVAPPDANTVKLRASDNLVAMWWSGETEVTIATKLPDPVTICCSIRGALRPVAGTDYQAITARLKGRDVPRFDIILRMNGQQLVKQPWPVGAGTPNGLHAGRLIERDLTSPDGVLRRHVTIYLPSKAASEPPMPALLIADGQAVAGLAQAIDVEIVAGRLPPVMLVGVANDPSHRSEEYVPGLAGGGSRYAAHAAFVKATVIPAAEASAGRPVTWMVGGMSDGAAWAIDMLAHNPRLFHAGLALSPVYAPVAVEVKGVKGARLFVGFGDDETHPADIAKAISANVPDRRLACTETAPGGHDMRAWGPLLVRGLAWLTKSNPRCQS